MSVSFPATLLPLSKSKVFSNGVSRKCCVITLVLFYLLTVLPLSIIRFAKTFIYHIKSARHKYYTSDLLVSVQKFLLHLIE